MGAFLCALILLLSIAPLAVSAQELLEDEPVQTTFSFDPQTPGQFSVVTAAVPDSYLAAEVRIWTRADRSDLRRYDLAPDTEGLWTAYGSSADFDFRSGTYWAEIAAIARDGSEEICATTSAALHYEAGMLYLPQAGSSPFYSFRLMQPQIPADCPVWFMVWSQASGSDRMILYPGRLDDSGDYLCMVPISAHGDSGKYSVGVFCGTREDPVFLTSGSFEIPGVDSAALQIAEQDGARGTMRVRVNLQSSAPVREVSLAAWSAPDQSNLCWYPMEPDGDGYAATVDISRHGNQFGEYTLHAYAQLANGTQTLAAGTAARLDPRNYVSVQHPAPGDISIQILGPSSDKLTAAVWSIDGGQDDLIWYSAANTAENTASISIEPYRHGAAGEYVAHIYAGDELVNSTGFSVGSEDILNPVEAKIYRYCQQVYSEVGRDLHSVYLWTVRNIKYVAKDWNRGYSNCTLEQAFALEGLEQRKGDCHTFSSTFAYLARGLGYDAKYVLGYVWSVRQVWATHSFVIVHMPDGDYICDPELQAVSKTGKDLYMQPAGRSKAKYKW